MIEIFTYKRLLKSIIYLLIVGQLWANAICCCQCILDSKSELIELCKSENSESEEEIDKKDKDEKLRVHLYKPKFDISISQVRISHSGNMPSICHLEIIPPPPEPSHLLS